MPARMGTRSLVGVEPGILAGTPDCGASTGQDAVSRSRSTKPAARISKHPKTRAPGSLLQRSGYRLGLFALKARTGAAVMRRADMGTASAGADNSMSCSARSASEASANLSTMRTVSPSDPNSTSMAGVLSPCCSNRYQSFAMASSAARFGSEGKTTRCMVFPPSAWPDQLPAPSLVA